jgi:hypothetical protein
MLPVMLERMSEKGFSWAERSGKLRSWQELHWFEHLGSPILTKDVACNAGEDEREGISWAMRSGQATLLAGTSLV